MTGTSSDGEPKRGLSKSSARGGGGGGREQSRAVTAIENRGGKKPVLDYLDVLESALNVREIYHFNNAEQDLKNKRIIV